MGGIGSGWYERRNVKPTVEAGRSLDVRDWQRRGLLKPGLRFIVEWGQQGDLTLGIAVRMDEHHVVLAYRYLNGDGSLTTVEYPVALDWTPQTFSGRRVWFRCPTEGCGRRVAILHLGGFRFACRHCQGLVYSSQRETAIDRNLRRARKIMRQLGGRGPATGSYPKKPKGMRWRTYHRLIFDVNAATLCAMQAVLDKAGTGPNH